jgi:hypothetical protein
MLVGELSRTANLHLHQLCTAFREEVDAAIGRLSGVLPPRSTEITPNTQPKACITCTFTAAPSRGLATPFRIQFALEETEGSAALEAYARATRGLEETEIGWTHLGGFPKFAGLRDRLVDWLLEIAEEMIDNY